MNIERIGLGGIAKVYENFTKGANKKLKDKGESRPEDSVSLSADAVEIKKALEYASKVAEVRQDKVAELKERIQKGTYDVEGRLIAEKIVEDYLKGILI
ncbi:anti-sigma-28 factor, FlgM family [Caldanaerovirga acetigignens]|uniref:Negative regulator of flagellin synthesis n=1 Tax=Caldanaerovirga acetigignens TaxID=447595 RepID=A0A1M7ID21_9FIRM|nr:flagellar biosynthesis anti-sigma factor FlgM [Caldanaerovirga acetigignens]SHM38671.1 anti-sigma-28 factor, FlgM family [Caldanaerovirga acetigignens]